ncbi:MAG TPA: peptidoglycan DD-metalloendopeptidase family protein [Chiayiivirga sp.]|nr:peptidoglycan DD-metalloendopeptidase family protein [Chiayiivirga sp.]
MSGRCLLIAGVLLLSVGLVHAATDTPSRAAQEAEAQRKLDGVRAQIASLTEQRNALDGERNEAARALREADRSVNSESRALTEIDARIATQESELAELEVKRGELNTRLGTQREALATLLRSAYALGQHEQLKLLLAQDRIESLARVMAYNRYFQRERVGRIDGLMDELEALARIVQQVREQRLALDASRTQQQERIAVLESQREERRALVAGLDSRFKDANARLQALGRDERDLTALLEKLRDIFADIPDQLDEVKPFGQRRGQLSMPVKGKILSGFGGRLPDGRISHGWMIAAEAGTPVQAIAHGRVAFSDWIKGYGLIVILDHGDGYMSLYAQNDSLRREVGEWVNAGDVLASVGSSGGQSRPALYFELRRASEPIDPHGWFPRR